MVLFLIQLSKNKKPGRVPGLDEVFILDLGEARGTRDRRLSAV